MDKRRKPEAKHKKIQYHAWAKRNPHSSTNKKQIGLPERAVCRNFSPTIIISCLQTTMM